LATVFFSDDPISFCFWQLSWTQVHAKLLWQLFFCQFKVLYNDAPNV